MSHVEAWTRQERVFGPGGDASDTTVLRVLDELAARLAADGLPVRRLGRRSLPRLSCGCLPSSDGTGT